MLKPRFLPCLTLALASFLIPGRSSPADNWIEVRSPHFTVNTNAGKVRASPPTTLTEERHRHHQRRRNRRKKDRRHTRADEPEMTQRPCGAARGHVPDT